MARNIPIERVGQIVQAVVKELRDAGRQAKLKDLLDRVEPKLNLGDYEKSTYEKSGFVRWRTIVHFNSIGLVKAGYIQKSRGKWILTQQGENALDKPPGKFFLNIREAYYAWKKTQPTKEPDTEDIEEEESEEGQRQTAYDQAVEAAREGIDKHVEALGPYDFQKLVAELLKAMGYHIGSLASPGPDGGVDIVAYKDPLGSSTPRIRIQVKHRNQKVSAKEVRELEGVLRKEGDMGLIVSSGGLTSEAEREIRSSSKHIETMDSDKLIHLWQLHYDKVSEAGMTLLPLVKLHFLAPTEE